jgi:hypothetical protein
MINVAVIGAGNISPAHLKGYLPRKSQEKSGGVFTGCGNIQLSQADS